MSQQLFVNNGLTSQQKFKTKQFHSTQSNNTRVPQSINMKLRPSIKSVDKWFSKIQQQQNQILKPDASPIQEVKAEENKYIGMNKYKGIVSTKYAEDIGSVPLENLGQRFQSVDKNSLTIPGRRVQSFFINNLNKSQTEKSEIDDENSIEISHPGKKITEKEMQSNFEKNTDHWKEKVGSVYAATGAMLLMAPQQADAAEVASQAMNSTSMTIASVTGSGALDSIGVFICTSTILFIYSLYYNEQLQFELPNGQPKYYLNGKKVVSFPSDEADPNYNEWFGKEYYRLEGKLKKFAWDVTFSSGKYTYTWKRDSISGNPIFPKELEEYGIQELRITDAIEFRSGYSPNTEYIDIVNTPGASYTEAMFRVKLDHDSDKFVLIPMIEEETAKKQGLGQYQFAQ